MASLNEELLAEDPNSQSVEADDDAYYSPVQDGSVVVMEPDVLTIGRSERKKYLKKMSGNGE